jgi:hypothetical protein
MLAELERIPFDLPEAESEIVAGWLTELSGMMYGLVQLGSYLKLYAFQLTPKCSSNKVTVIKETSSLGLSGIHLFNILPFMLILNAIGILFTGRFSLKYEKCNAHKN